MRFSVIDGCVCPRPLYPILRKLKRESGCVYNSVYRGSDAARALHKNGKHTQAELYAMYRNGTGYPANPPGYSSHECRGDGVVGVRGAKLPWWRCGIDVNDSQIPAVRAAAAKLGWNLVQPYPSGSEYHHVNFTKRPARWKLLYHAVFGRRR